MPSVSHIAPRPVTRPPRRGEAAQRHGAGRKPSGRYCALTSPVSDETGSPHRARLLKRRIIVAFHHISDKLRCRVFFRTFGTLTVFGIALAVDQGHYGG